MCTRLVCVHYNNIVLYKKVWVARKTVFSRNFQWCTYAVQSKVLANKNRCNGLAWSVAIGVACAINVASRAKMRQPPRRTIIIGPL